MAFWIFLALMLLAIAIVLRDGQFEERVVLATLVVNFVGTPVLYTLGGADWLQPHFGIFVLDSTAFVILTILALRSKRFWPLPIAAFQMIPVMTFFVSSVGENLKSYGLGVAQGSWGFLQLVILIWATIRTRQRQKIEPGM